MVEVQRLARDHITELRTTCDHYLREAEDAVSEYFNSFKWPMDEEGATLEADIATLMTAAKISGE